MLKNYLKTTLRSFIRNKTYTFINIVGLTLGISCALAIFLIIRFERSFDSYHNDGDRIFRLVTEVNEFGKTSFTSGVPFPLPAAMRTDFPEIEQLTIVDNNFGDPVISIPRADGSIDRYEEKTAAFVNPGYFTIFTYEWLQGNPEKALAEPGSAVISKSLARKYFENEDPMGQLLKFNSTLALRVAGVVEDAPPNSDLPFNLILAFDPEERGNDNWGSTSSAVQCYMKLPERINPSDLESRFDAFIEKHRNKEAADKMTLFLQPLREVHFDMRVPNFNWRKVAPETLVALGLIGVFLLVTACINFINLNTALTVKRSKEVGVRKVLGGRRFQLLLHFLGETAFITLVAILLSLAITEVMLINLNDLLGYKLSFNLLGHVTLGSFLFLLFLFVTFTAGFYPALHLSGFNPVAALRNKLQISYGTGLSLRKGLVVLQFGISQALIIGAIVIGSQMEFLRSVDMGFTKDAIVEVSLPSNSDSDVRRLKTEMLQQPGVLSVSCSNTGTASSNDWGGNYKLQDGEALQEGHAQIKFVDDHFIDTYQVDLLAGEGFAVSDTLQKFVVNETFAREVGYGDRFHDLFGKGLEIWGRKAHIAGVVRDFNTTSLRNEVKPVVMLMQNRYQMAGIKIDMRQASTVLPGIEKTWLSVYESWVFSYTFLDQAIENFYEEEQKMAWLVNSFTIIAILIGCMGLFGLVSYMATQRTKEIGIRKVLGATLANILSMFSREFALLIAVAFIFAGPIAYYITRAWLNGFAYRIDLTTGTFLIALAASALIVFITVGYKSVRAAAANPVDSLRYE